MLKRIAILGSTGSIGKNALRVIEALNSSLVAPPSGVLRRGSSLVEKLATEDTKSAEKETRLLRRHAPRNDEFEVVALSAHSNVELLAEQAKRFRPKFVAVTNPECAGALKKALGGLDAKVLAGPQAIIDIAESEEADTVLAAVVGAAGLEAVLAAAKKGKRLAIANKEPLVVAGQLLIEAAKQGGAEILPIDSEHSAIFQAMQSPGNCRADWPVPGLAPAGEIEKVILTSSGGPFRKASPEDIRDVTLEQALAHPVWDMGPKITIDSATMMNKALEVIEAHVLFDVPVDKIEILIHPESMVHSLVEFVDGSVMAQLAWPDMCLPIQYALTYPERMSGVTKRLRFDEIESLTFEQPNLKIFRALSLGFEVARIGGTAPAVFNAANEEAVRQFLEGRIKFVNIVELIEHCLNKHSVDTKVSLEKLLKADEWARRQVAELIGEQVGKTTYKMQG